MRRALMSPRGARPQSEKSRSLRKTGPGRRSNLVRALCRAGVPALCAEQVLTVVSRSIYDALWRTLADARRDTTHFDPLTALLENANIEGMCTRHDVDEELLAASLTIVLPRLMGQVRDGANANDHAISSERFAIRILSCLLRHKFPRGSRRAGT